MLNELPVPIAPLMLELHAMFCEMLPSSASIALPANVTFVSAGNEAPLSGAEIITVGSVFGAVTVICLLACQCRRVR